MLSSSGYWEPRASRERREAITDPCPAVLNLSSPIALVVAAKSHPEVTVQAVAARNLQRAQEFAKSNGIPEVKDSYQGKLLVSKMSSPSPRPRLQQFLYFTYFCISLPS